MLLNWGETLAKKNKEFEKSRQDVLRMAREMEQQRKSDAPMKTDERKFAWEYEILEYRRRKKVERFLMIGAISGVISLAISVLANYQWLITLVK